MFFLLFLLASGGAVSARAEITLSPLVIVEMEYTDNVFRSEKNEKSDFITTVTTGLEAAFLRKTCGLEISYRPSYSSYARFEENNTLRHDANIYAWKNISKSTQFELHNNFLHTEDPLGEKYLIDDYIHSSPGVYTERTSRKKYYSNTASANLTHILGRNRQLEIELLYAILENDDIEIEDNERIEPQLKLEYWFNQQYGLKAALGFTKGFFTHEPGFPGVPMDDFENWRGSFNFTRRFSRHWSVFCQYDHIYRNYDGRTFKDYEVWLPSVGLNLQIEKDMNFNIGFGYLYQEIEEDDNVEGFIVNALMNKVWNFKRATISLVGETGLRQNDFGPRSLGLERFISVGSKANYAFSRRLTGSIEGDFKYSDVKGSDEINGIERQLRYLIGMGLDYLPYKWMTITIDYDYLHYDAEGNIEIEDERITENRLIIGVELKPSTPWRY